MKRLGVIVCLLAWCGVATAQQADSAYLGRFERLHKTYAERPGDVDNLVQLAQFYFDNGGLMRSLPTAMDYAREAEARYVFLVNNNKYSETARLVKKGITIVSVRELEASIVEAAKRTVASRDEMSSAEISRYMASFAFDADIVRRLKRIQLKQTYAAATTEGTVESYYSILQSYPSTTEAEEAERMLATLAPTLFAQADATQADAIAGRYALSPSVRRAAAACKSRLAFAEADRQATLESYSTFMQQFPSSTEFVLAAEQYDALLSAQLDAITDPTALADFAEQHDDNPLADSAVARLVHMALHDRNNTAAQVYLDRFEGDSRHDEVFMYCYAWHTEEGNAAPLEYFAERYPDFPFQNVLFVDLDRAREADGYAMNETFAEEKYPAYANYIRRLMGKRLAFVPMQRMLQQLVAQRNWFAVGERLWQFDMCFETTSASEYNELVALAKAPVNNAKTPTVEFAPNYIISHPVFSSAGNRLYYTRHTGTTTRVEVVTRQGKHWSAPQTVHFSNAADSGLCIYSLFDNDRQMLLGHDGDIWIASRRNGTWQVTDIPPYPLNTDFIETDACMVPDGSGMLLASDRPGGYNLQRSGDYFHGDTALATDLYFVPRTQSGWGTPVNLGPEINTPYCERSPVLSSNGRTLFFATDSRGLGYADIYEATRQSAASWQKWSAPVNVGKEINTGFDEVKVGFGEAEHRLYYLSRSAQTGLPVVMSCAAWHHQQRQSSSTQLSVLGMKGYLLNVDVCDAATQTIVQTIEHWGDSTAIGLSLNGTTPYVLIAGCDRYYIPPVALAAPAPSTAALQGFTARQLIAMEQPIALLATGFGAENNSPNALTQLQLQYLARFMCSNPDCHVELIVSAIGQDSRECYDASVQRAEAMRSSLQRMGVQAERIHISPYGNVLTAQQRSTPEVQLRFR